MGCHVVTPGVQKLAKDLNINTEILKGILSTWENHTKKKINLDSDLPSAKELKAFYISISEGWAQFDTDGYEVSTKGDGRFSALNAFFKPGTVIEGEDVSVMSIEDVYQKVIKKSEKKAPPAQNSKLYKPDFKEKDAEEFSFLEGYLPLWRIWAEQNPELMRELREKSQGKILTDRFANTRVSQARALAILLKEAEGKTDDEAFPIKQKNQSKSFKKVETRKVFKRKEVKEETDKVFLFGDNIDDAKNGYIPHQTQAVIRGLPNAIGIPTKRTRGRKKEDYFTDDDFDEVKPLIDEAIKKAKESGKTIVLPEDGIGTGVAQLEQRAPKIFKYLQEQLEALQKEEEQNDDEDTTSSTQTLLENKPARKKITILYSPQVRRDRATLIANMFSVALEQEIEEEIEKAEQLIERLENIEENSKDAARLKAWIKVLRSDEGHFEYLKTKEYGAYEIFMKVKQYIQDEINASDEELIQAELDFYAECDDFSEIPEEEQRELAEKTVKYRKEELLKMIDDDIFKILCEDSALTLITTEKILIRFDKVENPISTSEGLLGETTDRQDMEDKEEDPKEGWMMKFAKISAWDSLSKNVKQLISKVQRINDNGEPDVDDLGYNRYLDASYVCATILDITKDMIEPADMMVLLEKNSNKYKWLQSIIDILNEEESLKASFYSNFRKEFINFWTQQKIENSDGTVTFKTVILNKSEGTYYLLDAWRDNQATGNVLSSLSIYNKNGSINIENAKKLEETIKELRTKYWDIARIHSVEEVTKLFKSEDGKLNEEGKKVYDLLKAVGITVNEATLYTFLSSPFETKSVTNGSAAMWLLSNVENIAKNVAEQKNIDLNNLNNYDLINNFAVKYNLIAVQLTHLEEGATEDMVYQNGASYWAHNAPSYFSKLIKNLKNSMQDNEIFKKFIEEQFGQYEWFRTKDGQWLNDWLALLTDEKEGAEARKALQTKVIIDSGKQEYKDWSELDYMLVLMNEFFAEEKSNYAYYSIPVLADNEQAHFIRFRKYKTGDKFDDNGDELSYEEIILQKFISVVKQEFERILLVEERARRRANGEDIGEIDNFDKFGKQFLFLPALNSATVDDMSFIDWLKENWTEGADLDDVYDVIHDTLQVVMEDMFEEDFAYFKEIGLFQTLKNGKYKFFKENTNVKQLATLKAAIEKAEKLLGETEEIKRIKQTVLNDEEISDRELQSLLSSIKTQLTTYGKQNNINVRNILNSLKFKDAAKEKVREFFYNNVLAQINIIQLTETDLAYYGPITNYYKRNKQIMGSGSKLFTEATFRGKKVGRQIEKSIYIADEKIISEIVDDLKEIILKQLQAGKINDYDACYILASYGSSNYTDPKTGVKYYKIGDTYVKTQKINTTDGQSFRTLDSYRSLLNMQGEWTDEMEEAYLRLKKGEFSVENFNIIWQPKKPFVYTQTAVDNGVGGKMKVGTQHKNSEFLLLAMYDFMAESMKGKSRLSELNRFMEDNNIDVVHFESVVKIGGHHIMSLNGLDTTEIYDYLTNVTGVKTPQGSNDFVHTIDYGDYCIQTVTPEHFFDTTVILGTQIRKLITADMPDDMKITIHAKTLSKKEWYTLYQNLLTENIIDAFAEVYEIMHDKKKISQILQDEINSNPRYSRDLLEAVSLDENGEFNQYLFDPVNGERVQQMLLSILRNRVTRQKIKGGSVVQVSNFGFNDNLRLEIDKETGAIKYMECMLPAYAREFFEELIDPKTHLLDINKLPEDLRKIIGYRIPTESKYSMAPLYIKGFLPSQNGACIMLPKEITTIAGSDFDRLSMSNKNCVNCWEVLIGKAKDYQQPSF